MLIKLSRDVKTPTDGEEVTIASTSASTADVSPIVLDESETDVTRTLFCPKLVYNPNEIEKSVSGKLVYEKRKVNDQYPTEKITRQNVKVGELMELSLNTSATFKLFNYLSTLYQTFDSEGIPYGQSEYKRIDSTYRGFYDLLHKDPNAAILLGQEENYELYEMLLDLMTKASADKALANALNSLNSDSIERLSNSLGTERLSRLIEQMEQNIENGHEEFWQTLFRDNQWVLSQLFASPCTLLKDKVYVGGKGIENKGGNICDFLYENEISRNVSLIEIKTPRTKIIQDAYRNTFSFSLEMSGAINQVLNYRDSLMKEFYNLQRCSASQEFYAFNPKCIVVIGSLAAMNADGLSAFENYRNSLSNIEIIAFDEVLQRLKDLRSILEEDTSAQ